MTLKTPSRAGLLALAFGLLLALILSVSLYSTSYAQTPAPGATPAATAAPTPPPPAPACANDPDPKKAVLTKCAPNSGDTAWMLTSVALVLMMTVPGLGLFYGGLTRKKNVGDTVMTSFAITCLVTIIFAILTYSLAFTSGSPYIGGLSRVFLQGIVSDIATGAGNPNGLAVDDSRNRLHVLPDDVRDHHACADRGRFRRAHEVLGDAVVHRLVVDLRLRADRALGLGLRRHAVGRQPRRHDPRARLRRRHRRAYQLRRRRPDVRHLPRQAQGNRPAA